MDKMTSTQAQTFAEKVRRQQFETLRQQLNARYDIIRKLREAGLHAEAQKAEQQL